MKTHNIDTNRFEQDLLTTVQTRAYLADTQNLWIDGGRGLGKTTRILAPRMVRLAYDMPRSQMLLIAPTFIDLLSNILPALSSYLNKYYIRGIHYEYGKIPPKHFRLPIRDVGDWKKTLIFANGTCYQFGSMDRPESILGRDFVHVVADELLKFKEEDFVERVTPTLRSDRVLWGNSPYYGGITGTSSTPNIETDHDWWLKMEENMDTALIDEIMDVALTIDHQKYKSKTTSSDSERERADNYIATWTEKLRKKRAGATTFIKASSLSNILILGPEYLKTQYKGSRSNIDKFNLSILGIRPKQVKEMFFGKFTKNNVYTDSYKYDRVDLLDASGEFIKSSADLKYCNPDLPLIAGFDPGHFMSIVFGQFRNSAKEYRVFKNLYVTHPQQHSELAELINNFFRHHKRKHIKLHYDRAANQKKQAYRNNSTGKTDARILQTELQKLGWKVDLLDLKRETIYHYLHYILLNILFGKKDSRTPDISICQNECKELVSSIFHSPLLRKNGEIFLDKSSEDKLDLEEQAMYSTQIATSLMYMLYGLFEQYLPLKAKAGHAYSMDN